MKNLNSMSLKLESGSLLVLDQVRLPHEEVWVLVESSDHMVKLIQDLSVRGAPLIGVAAALSLAVDGMRSPHNLKKKLEDLREARPTAVNLASAMNRMEMILNDSAEDLFNKAIEIFEEDADLCERMGNFGETLIHHGDGILTHCNTGGLATVGLGTALAAIIKAHQNKKKIHVYVDETRPLLQGGRLTTWELKKHGVPHTLICDNMAASLMAKNKIQKAFVGSDRIAKNGDAANKIGTYSAAILAKHHQIPFYVVAPSTTVDLSCATGEQIPIEERNPNEVMGYKDIAWAPEGTTVWNPAFDVTPINLITAIVLDTGVFSQSQLKDGFSSSDIKKLS